MRILAAMLQVEINPVQNASFVFVSSGFGEFETGLLSVNEMSTSLSVANGQFFSFANPLSP